ncbi:molybdopterin synthase catalytic subunit MoaE [Bowmanella yangjiangensis]|nr:molybdopterin synthase catalytic subunit MoaE [Bowmanella yangjiangensis]
MSKRQMTKAPEQEHISVQQQDFDLAAEYQALTANNQSDGAVVHFVGLVRDNNLGRQVQALELEHYPAMTSKALSKLVDEARQRWDLGRIRLIHRVGKLSLGEQIVFVGVTSKHRGSAFAACEFLMDQLKTRAPFWKKEHTSEGAHWVAARASDQVKAGDW